MELSMILIPLGGYRTPISLFTQNCAVPQSCLFQCQLHLDHLPYPKSQVILDINHDHCIFCGSHLFHAGFFDGVVL